MGKEHIHKDIILILVFTSFTCILLYRKIWSIGAIQFIDIAPPMKNALDSVASAWNYQALGSPNAIILGAVLEGLFGVVGQKVVLLLPMPLSVLTMYVFLRNITRSTLARVLVSYMFGFNPFTMGLFGGLSPGIVWPYSLSPLLILFFIRVADEDHMLVNTLSFSLVLGVASMFNAQAPIMLLPIFAMLALTCFVLKRKPKYILSILLVVITALATTLVLNIPFYFTQVVSILLGRSGVISTFPSSYFIEGIPGTYSQPAAINLRFFFTFATSAFVLLLFIIHDYRKRLLYLSFLLVNALTVLFWYIFPTKAVLATIASIPLGFILFLWGDFVKLPMLIMVSYSVLSALALDEVAKSKVFQFNFNFGGSANRTIVRIALAAVVLLLVILPVFAYGLIPETQFDLGNYVGGPNLSQYQVPPVYEQARNWLIEHGWNQTSFRIVWLPLDPVGTVFTYIPNAFFSTDKINELVFGDLLNRGANFAELVGSFGVKYVVVNMMQQQPVEWHQGQPRLLGWGLNYYPIGDPNEFVKLLSQQRDLKLIENNTDFVVFKSLAFVSKISVPYAGGLVLYMPFDKDTGSSAVDMSGQGNNGTIHQATWTTGRYGQGLYFQRSSAQYVSIPSSSSLNAPYLTVSAWVKFDLIPNHRAEQIVVQKWNRFAMEVFFDPTQGTGAKFRGFIWINGKIYTLDGAPYDLKLNTWYLFTMTYDGTSLTGYVNGTIVQSMNIPGQLSPSTDPVLIGGNGNPNPTGITIDDVRVYNSSLSPFQVNSLYQNILSDEMVRINSIKQTGPTSYKLSLTSEEPFYLVFLESYDPSWSVHFDNVSLPPFPVFGWANGFHVNAIGNITLEITYRTQSLWTASLITSILLWIALTSIVSVNRLFLFLDKRKGQSGKSPRSV